MSLAQDRLTWGLPLIAALAALLAFCALQFVAYHLAGAFDYPLDDPYIHLAMADGIARGTYGVNIGEAASAASSILYPVLLAPFASAASGQYAPVILNTVMLGVAGALWGAALALGGFRGVWAVLAALLGPILLNMPMVAFSGMEHSAHLVASLLIVLGLSHLIRTGRVSVWFALALLIAPLLRLEGLALAGLALLVLIWRGKAWSGGALALILIAAIAGYMAYLTGQGLSPVPGSVMAKIEMGAPSSQALASGPLKVLAMLGTNLNKPGGLLLAALVAVALLMPRYVKRLREEGRDTLLRVIAVAGFAHLLFGQIGWMDRYEHYILVTLMAGLALAMAGLGAPDHRLMARVLSIALVLLGALYLPHLRDYIYAPRGLHLQQAQMARMAQQIQAPVAVNDLGRVAWRNPNYVLDIFGLGSAQALAARTNRPAGDRTWLTPLLAEHEIVLAMVYDSWFGGEMKATGWTKIGTLGQTEVHLGALGSVEVAFYAPPDHAEAMTRAATEWANDLPVGAYFKLGPRDGDGEVLTGPKYTGPMMSAAPTGGAS